MMNNHGILLLNKAAGVTSFSALYPVKKTLSKKAGHAGTLDKFATGLLLVLLGKYTKLNTLFSNLDKTYDAVFYLGAETDTLDPEGSVVRTADIPDISRMKSVVPQFTGIIEQTPPAYSAVHINGKRAYKEVRQGRNPDMPSRKITIYDFSIIEWNKPFLSVRIHCSKGTYIRSLARDFGIASGSAAYVVKLTRTAIGPYRLEEAVSAEELHAFSVADDSSFLGRIPRVQVFSLEDTALHRLKNGILPDMQSAQPLNDSLISGKPQFYVFCSSSGKVAAVTTVEWNGTHGSPEKFLCIV
jgi:tRNA pseudouridine55 synthase